MKTSVKVSAGEFTFDVKDYVKKSMQTLADEVIKQIVDKSDVLGNSRWNYVSSIVVENDDSSFSISLEGFLANALENGLESFDMKPGFKKSSKATVTSKGWFLTIPISQVENITQSIDPSVARYISTITKPQQSAIAFRTVSNKSTGWIHKGIEARRIMNEAIDSINVGNVLKNAK